MCGITFYGDELEHNFVDTHTVMFIAHPMNEPHVKARCYNYRSFETYNVGDRVLICNHENKTEYGLVCKYNSTIELSNGFLMGRLDVSAYKNVVARLTRRQRLYENLMRAVQETAELRKLEAAAAQDPRTATLFAEWQSLGLPKNAILPDSES